jgi:chromosome segregation ATPase
MSLVREANRFTVAVELHDAEVLETNALHVGDRKKRIILLDVDARRAVNDRAGWKRFDEFGKHFRDVFAEVQPLLAGEERQELLDGLEEAARKPSAAEREAAAKELVAWVEEQRETEFSELSRERLQKLLGGLAGVFARYDAQQVRQGMEQLADLAVLRKKLEALARTVVDTQQTIAWIPEAIKEQRQELETGLAADRSAEEMEAMRERIRELERTREKLEGTLRELKPKYEEAIAAAKKAMTELADQTAAVRRELLDLSREIAAEALEDVPETVRVDPQWQITVHYGRPGTTLPDVLAAEAGR